MQIHHKKTKLNRKGLSIVETLTVIAISSMMLPALSHLSVVLLRDIPTSQKLIYAASSVNHFLNNLQTDIETNPQILTSFADHRTDPNNLLIKTDTDSVILYQLKKNSAEKHLLSENSSKLLCQWSLRRARINFNCLTRDKKTYAIEVFSHIVRQRSEKQFKKMQMANLYFVNSMQKGL